MSWKSIKSYFCNVQKWIFSFEKTFLIPMNCTIYFWASSLAWNKWYNINWCKLHLNKMKVKERSHMSVASLLKEKHFLWHHMHYLYFYLYLLFDWSGPVQYKEEWENLNNNLLFDPVRKYHYKSRLQYHIVTKTKWRHRNKMESYTRKKELVSSYKENNPSNLAIFFNNNNNHFTDRKCVGGELYLKIIVFYNK